MRKSLEQKIATAERALVRLREDERKVATRRKIIVGALLLEEANRNVNFGRWLADRLRQAKRPADVLILGSIIQQLDTAIQLPRQEPQS